MQQAEAQVLKNNWEDLQKLQNKVPPTGKWRTGRPHSQGNRNQATKSWLMVLAWSQCHQQRRIKHHMLNKIQGSSFRPVCLSKTLSGGAVLGYFWDFQLWFLCCLTLSGSLSKKSLGKIWRGNENCCFFYCKIRKRCSNTPVNIGSLILLLTVISFWSLRWGEGDRLFLIEKQTALVRLPL